MLADPFIGKLDDISTKSIVNILLMGIDSTKTDFVNSALTLSSGFLKILKQQSPNLREINGYNLAPLKFHLWDACDLIFKSENESIQPYDSSQITEILNGKVPSKWMVNKGEDSSLSFQQMDIVLLFFPKIFSSLEETSLNLLSQAHEEIKNNGNSSLKIC